MNLAKKLWMTTGDSSGGGPAPSGGYVDDVFSAYTYQGTSATRALVTGQDLATFGGMVHIKGRSGTYGGVEHCVYHQLTGTDYRLDTANNGGKYHSGTGTSLYGWLSDGFRLGTAEQVNSASTNYVAWVFRNAPRFYGHQVVTKLSGSNRTVNFPELVTLGMVRVKSTDQPGSWYVWHRSLPAGQLLIGETNVAAATLGHITVSGTAVTLVNGVIADGTYLVETWAHDTEV